MLSKAGEAGRLKDQPQVSVLVGMGISPWQGEDRQRTVGPHPAHRWTELFGAQKNYLD